MLSMRAKRGLSNAQIMAWIELLRQVLKFKKAPSERGLREAVGERAEVVAKL